jgi:Ser/Thr protein kinase RdoA (MazF antagonist)
MSTPTVESSPLPLSVASAYFADTPDARRLSGGELNATYLAETPRRRLILQRLSPIFGKLVVQDMAHVTTELSHRDWDVPLVVPARDGELTATEQKPDGTEATWRAITVIDADAVPPADQRTPETYEAFGEILGRLHGDLAKVDYTPQFAIPHFQETPYHLGRLEAETLAKMPDQATTHVAEEILRRYASLPALPEGDEQLIHGDPRTANMLAKDGMPYTYIDWDTIMKASIWVDIGDFMRSLAEDAVQAGKPVPLEDLRHVAEGYRRVAMPDVNPDEFFGWAITATERIALTLASRYANDIVDDRYFGYDETRYASRRDNHVDRIKTQMQILDGLSAATQEKEQ